VRLADLDREELLRERPIAEGETLRIVTVDYIERIAGFVVFGGSANEKVN
jgi:hypothetical protein